MSGHVRRVIHGVALSTVPGFHAKADQRGDAGACTQHLHDGHLVAVQGLWAVPSPHVVRQAERGQLLPAQVFVAGAANGNLAFLA